MKPVAAEKIGPAQLVAVSASERTPLCDVLVETGKLESSDVERALRLQREQDDWERVGSILVKLGLVSDVDVAQGLSRQLEVPLVDKADFPDEIQDDWDSDSEEHGGALPTMVTLSLEFNGGPDTDASLRFVTRAALPGQEDTSW